MAGRDRTLARLLRKPAISALVADQIDRLGPDHVVAGPSGQALAGDATRLTGTGHAVLHEGKVIGHVHGAQAGALGALLAALAAQDAEARALARESLHLYREITTLYEVSERIIASPDAPSVATIVTEEAAKLLGCDSVAVLLLNESTGRLEIAASRGPTFHSRTSLDVGTGVIAAVLGSGSGEIVNDVTRDARSLGADNALRSIVCSPLKSKRRTLGVVVAGSETPRHFNASDLQLLNAMSAQAAAAIEAAHLDRDLQRTSRKPADLIYGVDDRPPLVASAVLGLQHVFIAMMSLAYPVLVTLEAGGSRAEASSVVSMSLIAMALATLLQANRVGPVGSGFLAPHITSAIYLGASLLAARLGGLGLVFGMTVVSGAFGLMLSQVLGRFRKLFPPEVSGVVVLMVGLSMVPVALQRFLGLDGTDSISEPAEWLVGATTLGAIVALTIAPLGYLRLYSTFLGVLAGYVAAVAVGLVSGATFGPVLDLPLLGVPPLPQTELSFSPALLAPFLAAALASGIKDAGLVTSVQKLNDAQWKRPEARSVSGGIAAGGVANVVSGLLGGIGLGISAGSIGLSAATGATSRIIGVFVAAIFLALAFMPMVTAAVALMPSPVMGAGLLYVACHLVTSGAELITSRMLDTRRTYVIGLALLGGVGVMAMPDLFQTGPDWAQATFGNPLAVSTVLAVTLNLALSAWVSSSARVTVVIDDRVQDRIADFCDRQGAMWGARSDVIRRAAPAITEWCEELKETADIHEALVELRFDEFHLAAAVRIPGTEKPLAAVALPAEEQTLEQMLARLARRYDCRARLHGVDEATFDFEH